MIHITDHKKGLKMSGFISINTSVFLNPFCEKSRKNKTCICSKCYAVSIENTYRNLHKNLIENYKELSTRLSEKSLTDIVQRIQEKNRLYVRFHSFGEISNIEHLENFYSISHKLPDNIFGLWTKRKDLITLYNPYAVPKNISLVYSNPIIDKPINQVPKRFNAVFNVVSYDYCVQNKILPNCHGKCIECLKCYRPDKKFIAIELLKSDQTKITKGTLKPLEEMIL